VYFACAALPLVVDTWKELVSVGHLCSVGLATGCDESVLLFFGEPDAEVGT